MTEKQKFIIDIIKNIEPYTELELQALLKLSLYFTEKVFSINEIIFEEGQIGNSMMLITSGDVRITHQSPDGTEEALMILKTGEVFGEMALLDEMPRSASAIAHTDVVLFEINRLDFLNFIHTDQASGVKLLFKMAQMLSSRLREADTKIKVFNNLTKWI
jgi:CRP-like cAMP-binding protein